MATATNEIDIDRSADDVWKVVRDFGGVAAWVPGVDSCRVEGDVRFIEMLGMAVSERLVRLDDDARTFVYSIVEGPVPFEHHEATIAVSAIDDGSAHVTYTVDVVPGSMVEAMSDAYAGLLRELKSSLEHSI